MHTVLERREAGRIPAPDVPSPRGGFVVGIALLLLVTVTVAGLVIWNAGRPSPTAAPAPSIADEAGGLSQRGSGDGTVDLTHPGGVAILKFAHAGTGVFVVAVSGPGADGLTVVSDRGQVAASRALMLPAGDYEAVVTAEGDWAVGWQVARQSDASVPRRADGRGSGIVGPFRSEGVGLTFTMRHRGPGSVTATLLPLGGEEQHVLFEDLANAEAEAVVELDAAAHILDVEGAGRWVLETGPVRPQAR